MSLAHLLAAMMENAGEVSSISRTDAEKKLKANTDKLLPKFDVLRESGKGLVQFVNFVEVLRRQLKSGSLRVGSQGSLIWALHEKLEDRRNAVLKIVRRHRSVNVTDTTMAEAVDAHPDDFKDVVLFDEDDLVALNLLVKVQKLNKKNPTVTRKRMPYCKMAAYFHVLALLDDAFEVTNMFSRDPDSDDE